MSNNVQESATNKPNSVTDETVANNSLTSSDNHNHESSLRPASDAAAGDKVVAISKVLFLLVLAIAASTLAFLTYLFTSNEEKEDMVHDFKTSAEELISISQENVRKVFGILEGLSIAATSFAIHEDSKWPFVTIPNFNARGEAALRASQALILAYVPLVSEDARVQWEQYSVENQGWIQQAYTNSEVIEPIQDMIYSYDDSTGRKRRELSSETCEDGLRRQLKDRVPEEAGSGPYAPVWQLAPPPLPNATAVINYNLFDKPVFKKAVDFIKHTRKPVFLDVCNQAKWFGDVSKSDTLQTVVVYPIFEDLSENSKVVASLVAVAPWKTFFENILHEGAPEVTVVMENTCNEVFSFAISGHEATFLAEEDLHDQQYTHFGSSSTFAEFANPKELLDSGLGEHCVYDMHVYPSESVEKSHITNNPIKYAMFVLLIFLSTSVIFILYDFLVQRRQNKMKTVQIRASLHQSLISSLFPDNVRDRLIEGRRYDPLKCQLSLLDIGANDSSSSLGENKTPFTNPKKKKKGSKPIADLYPEATVMFADISGFTAWSSVRDPEQVFTLLEILYHSFDKIGEQHGVFKVETIGDTYVAVCGLPESCPDHVIVMAQFARECRANFKVLTKRLEPLLGPETTDLKMRFGLHSGPVTAGVLRGKKARYQLFGDTVNTASRMESTGTPNKIQVSRETADLLRAAGKAEWLKKRDEPVDVKGKGLLETYYLTTTDNRSSLQQQRSLASNTENSCMDECDETSEKVEKLVEWNCALLLPHLSNIVKRRKASRLAGTPVKQMKKLESEVVSKSKVAGEVVEIITLPEYKASIVMNNNEKKACDDDDEVGQEIASQLKEYVTLLASMYNDNAFHCFEHASHVTMSTSKLLARIVAPSGFVDASNRRLHDHTYGITSDPLTQFSVILAALIHDVDHRGISNNVLVKENPSLGEKYDFQSVAEQNSVDLAWNALMDGSKFEALRRCIYQTETELKRFRQLIVSSVMATDIFEKKLGALRKRRWEKAFSNPVEETQEDVNRKATIVIEHLIQASDVSHTMQHWIVYQKWNKRLFQETYTAYVTGRIDKDPSEGWYKGEIWFFDNYVIPLAKKLKDCGVFGVSSDEYLNYAVANRREWEVKGNQVVTTMKRQCDQLLKLTLNAPSNNLVRTSSDKRQSQVKKEISTPFFRTSSDSHKMATTQNRRESM